MGPTPRLYVVNRNKSVRVEKLALPRQKPDGDEVFLSVL